MSRPSHSPALNRFACVAAFITFCLLCLGGTVTSKGVGMSVPDWPNTYGYNMFLFPLDQWVGGVFFEHSHRLLASGVGLLTIVLAVWLWRTSPVRWLKHLGWMAVVGVILQGVLGGLRVVFDVHGWGMELGLMHATIGQLFLILMVFIALFTSPFWEQAKRGVVTAVQGRMRIFFLLTTALIFAQLLLGAAMRHQHAGLAIPDFPLAYGKVWPDTDPAAVAHYNSRRMEVHGYNSITAFQIHLQMAHRVMAAGITVAIVFCAWQSRSRLGGRHPLSKLSLAWIGLVAIQFALGAFTVLSDKAADVATAHVAVGALTLLTGAILSLLSRTLLLPASAPLVPAAFARAIPPSALSENV